MADPKGLAPSAFPQTTGCSGYLSYGSEEMVGGAGNAPVVTSDVCFATPDLQAGSRNTSLGNLRFTIYDFGFVSDALGLSRRPTGVGHGEDGGSGGGSCTHGGRVYEARLNLILPAMKWWWSRRVTLPHELACRASAFLVCHDP